MPFLDLLLIQLKQRHVQLADIGIAPRLLNLGHVDHLRLELVKLLLYCLHLLLLLLQLLLVILHLDGRVLDLDVLQRKGFQSLPFCLLEVLHGFEASQHDVLAAVLHAAPLNALHVSFAGQSEALHLLKLLGDLSLLASLFELVDDDAVLVVVLDLVEGIDNELVEAFLVVVGHVDGHVVIVIIVVVIQILHLRFAADEPFDEVHQHVLLEEVEVLRGGAVHQQLLQVLLVLLGAGGVLVDLLADCLEGAVLYLIEVLLQLLGDVDDEQLIALQMELILEVAFVVVVDDGDEHLVDEAQVVEAHEYVVGLVDGLDEGVEEGLELVLRLVGAQGLQHGQPVLHLPVVVLQHEQHVGSHCHVDRVVRTHQNDRVLR